MENAIWNGELLHASEIAKDYYLEKEIRKASAMGELLCPDYDCQNPILKYCHGEIKGAYFAHRDLADCDYMRFEKSSGLFHSIRLQLYEHFKKQGYSVHLEVKVLKHHYSHLLFEWTDGSRTAIELGTKSTTLKEIDSINTEYAQENMDVIWLVVDQLNKSMQEDHTYFLKRYCLNESSNRSLIVLSYDGCNLIQYKMDEQSYLIDDREYSFQRYPKLFSYEAQLKDMIFENDTLSTEGFTDAYNRFLAEKQFVYEQMRIKKEQEQLELQERYMLYQRNKALEKELEKSIQTNHQASDYELRKNSILSQINQQERRVIDAKGKRWIRCELCGKIKEESEFLSYGGPNHINLGECKSCKHSV